jgi:hypothetical protein
MTTRTHIVHRERGDRRGERGVGAGSRSPASGTGTKGAEVAGSGRCRGGGDEMGITESGREGLGRVECE